MTSSSGKTGLSAGELGCSGVHREKQQQLVERKVRKVGYRWFLCMQEELVYVESASTRNIPWKTTKTYSLVYFQ